MNQLRYTYRFALIVFFASAAAQPTIRRFASLGRWPALGLLILACFAAVPPRRRPIDGKSVGLLIVFLLVAIYATSTGIAADLSIQRLISVLLVIVTAAIFSGAWADMRGRTCFVSELVFMARVVSYSSILMLGAGINMGRTAGRFSGWASNPNELGIMLLLLVPPVIHRAFTRPSRGLFSEKFLLVIMGILMLASGSRAAIVGAGIGAIVCLWGIRKVRLQAVAGVGAVFGVLILVAGGITPLIKDVPGLNRFVEEETEFQSYEVAERAAMSGRGEVWALALYLHSIRPWIGYGWGVEAELLEQNSSEILYHQGDHVHNSYLSLILQVGLLGLIPILLLIVLALSRGFRFVQRCLKRNEHADGYSGVLLAIFVAGLAHAIFESWLFATGNLNSLILWPTWFFLLRGYLAPTRQPKETLVSVKAPAADAYVDSLRGGLIGVTTTREAHF